MKWRPCCACRDLQCGDRKLAELNCSPRRGDAGSVLCRGVEGFGNRRSAIGGFETATLAMFWCVAREIKSGSCRWGNRRKNRWRLTENRADGTGRQQKFRAVVYWTRRTQAHASACLADGEGGIAEYRTARESAHVAPQLCDPHGGKWRRLANRANHSWPRGYFYDTSVYTPSARPAEECVSETSSAGEGEIGFLITESLRHGEQLDGFLWTYASVVMPSNTSCQR